MTIDIRQASHPEAAKHYGTQDLRRHFLVERLFAPDEVLLIYSHVDRLVLGGAMPVGAALALPAPKAIGTDSFLKRRELGVLNIGGPGTVTVGAERHDLAARDALYVGKAAGEVSFASADPANPAKFYLVSTPAHAGHPTQIIRAADTRALAVGDPATSNRRVIRQYIVPEICPSCQLVMGVTQLEEGSVWNTMPAHIHDRRCEAYLYFALPDDARVFHFMGEPGETRHLLVANEQAILSPGWSIHSGAGTKAYAFVWAMGGDNQDYTDMDMIAVEDLR